MLTDLFLYIIYVTIDFYCMKVFTCLKFCTVTMFLSFNAHKELFHNKMCWYVYDVSLYQIFTYLAIIHCEVAHSIVLHILEMRHPIL
jgi:hypothetical protein